MAGSIFHIWLQLEDKIEKGIEAGDRDSAKDNSVNSVNNDNNDNNDNEDNLVCVETFTILERVEILLNKHKLTFFVKQGDTNPVPKDITSEENSSEKLKQVLIQVFVPEDVVEDVLLELQKSGVGVSARSGVSAVATAVNYFAREETEDETKRQSVDVKEDKVDRFYNSIKSRLIVAEVIKRIEEGAQFSFDYVCLVFVAAMLAFLGLILDSSVILVASMLISPIMGPILAGVFGISVKNKKLVKIGTFREVYSLLICIVTGFVLGSLFVIKLNRNGNVLSALDEDWPTKQMSSRTKAEGLLEGLLIALPSGVGVALSVLGGNSGSMVGVAISASLLPPAVNAGLYWSMSMISALSHDTENFNSGMSHDNITISGEIFDFEYDPNGDIPMELFYRGLVSLVLTILNIVCIALMGVFILFVKRVTPDRILQKNANFWTSDVVNHRAYEKKIMAEDIAQIVYGPDVEEGLAGTFIAKVFEEAANDEDVIDIQRWVDMQYPADLGSRFTVEPSPQGPWHGNVVEKHPYRKSGRRATLKRRSLHRKLSARPVTMIVEQEVENTMKIRSRSRTISEAPKKKLENQKSIA